MDVVQKFKALLLMAPFIVITRVQSSAAENVLLAKKWTHGGIKLNQILELGKFKYDSTKNVTLIESIFYPSDLDYM